MPHGVFNLSGYASFQLQHRFSRKFYGPFPSPPWHRIGVTKGCWDKVHRQSLPLDAEQGARSVALTRQLAGER
jgi:hypothetical protein